MLIFKTKSLLTSLLLAGLTLTMAACSLPKPQNGQSADGSSTFYVSSNSGDVRLDQDLDAYSLPKTRTYAFSSCVKDLARSKAIQDQTFEIQETGDKVTSDTEGCFYWNEKIAFNYLAKSQFVQIDRHIKATGLHRGVEVINLAINPWSHGESISKVIDLNKTNVAALVSEQKSVQFALQGLQAENIYFKSPLWVDEGRLSITEQNLLKGGGANLKLELRISPSIKLTSISGEAVYKKLLSGTFKTRVKLIQSIYQQGAESHVVLTSSDWISGNIDSGTLVINSNLILSNYITRGQYYLGLELSPDNGPKAMGNFEGIYLIGEADQLKTNGLLKLSGLVNAEKNDFSLEKYINSTLGAQLAMSADSYAKPKIEIQPLDFKYMGVGDETTSQREIKFNIKACFKNGLDQKNIRMSTFTIKKFRFNESEPAVTKILTADNSACINWDNPVVFKYYECQHFMTGFVQIQNAELGLDEKIAVAVNPWESWGAMARDLRYVESEEKIKYTCEEKISNTQQIAVKAPARLLFETYSFSTLNLKYAIDNNLNLSLIKRVQFKSEPKVNNYSSVMEGRSDNGNRLRDGLYLLKTVIVTNADYGDKQTYVTHAQKVVTVNNGQINTDLDFVIHNLRATTNRNKILISLHIIDEQKYAKNRDTTDLDSLIDTGAGLQSAPFIGPVVLGNDDQSTKPLMTLEPELITQYFINGQSTPSSTQNIINELIADGQKQISKSAQEFAALADKKSISQNANLELVNVNDSKSTQEMREGFASISNNFQKNVQINQSEVGNGQELNQIIADGKLSPENAEKMCHYWFNILLPKMNAIKPFANMALHGECMRTVLGDPRGFFKVEKQILVKKIAGQEDLQGQTSGFSVGTSFSTTNAKSESFSKDFSVSFSPKDLITSVVSFPTLGLNASTSMRWSSSTNTGTSNALNVGTNVALTVSQKDFMLNIAQYEQCATIHLNPEMYAKGKSSFIFPYLNDSLAENDMYNAVSRGVMICYGADQTQAIKLKESYYLIGQDFNNSTPLLDVGDEKNRNFYMALRSSKEFTRFLISVKATSNGPKGADATDYSNLSVGQMVIDIFKQGTQTYPGVMFLNQ